MRKCPFHGSPNKRADAVSMLLSEHATVRFNKDVMTKLIQKGGAEEVKSCTSQLAGQFMGLRPHSSPSISQMNLTDKNFTAFFASSS